MNTVVVQGGMSGFAQDIVVGHHQLTADEPESAGGGGRGPSPYDLLLAALGA
jgi:putative redox protein